MLSLLILASEILAVPRPQSQPIGVVNQWTCHPTFNIMLQLSAQGSEVQCKTRDAEGFHCLPCNEDFEGISYGLLTCGTDHQGKWGILGYGAAGHWCNTEKSTLKQATIPGPTASTTTPPVPGPTPAPSPVNSDSHSVISYGYNGYFGWNRWYRITCSTSDLKSRTMVFHVNNGGLQAPKIRISMGDATNACIIDGVPGTIKVERGESTYEFKDITSTLFDEAGVNKYDGKAPVFVDRYLLRIPDIEATLAATGMWGLAGSVRWNSEYKADCVLTAADKSEVAYPLIKTPVKIDNNYWNMPTLRITQGSSSALCTYGEVKGRLRLSRKRIEAPYSETEFKDITSQLLNEKGDGLYDGTALTMIDAEFNLHAKAENGHTAPEVPVTTSMKFKCKFTLPADSKTYETPFTQEHIFNTKPNVSPRIIVSSDGYTEAKPCKIGAIEGTLQVYRKDASGSFVLISDNVKDATDATKPYDGSSPKLVIV